MTLRTRGLPPGWYPDSPSRVRSALSEYLSAVSRGAALACMAPHAGWYYSGAIAAKAIAALDAGAETIVVFGGHLSGRASPLLASEDAFETPLGTIAADAELRDAVAAEIVCDADRYADNTVEVLLPMIRFLFPQARLLWMRLGADVSSYETGRKVSEIARSLGRTAVAVGSTDLTHYGPNYGFTGHGTGTQAVEWVKTVNDAAFLDAILACDGTLAIARSAADFSACSSGAAVGAMGFAAALDATSAELLAYGTSADIALSTSFVGYGAVAWSKKD